MEVSRNFRRMVFSLLLLSSLSLVGVIGFNLIEGYTPIDAFYMTVITMSTVGFGTIGDLTTTGKLFTSVLIIASAGTFLYAISTITTFVIEGEIRDIFLRFRISKRVANLNDHIIICGLGRNGRETALELIRQKKPFVVIEEDEAVIEDFLAHHEKTLFIQGNATNEEVLDRANIGSAAGLISALPNDAENVYITLTAREMNPRVKIVARASYESTISKLKRAGANEVILPNLIGGRKMANLLTRPALMEFVDMVSGEGSSEYHLEVFAVSNHAQLLGKTLAELNVRSRTGATIIGLKCGTLHVELNPQAHKVLDPEDRLFVLGRHDQIDRFKEVFLED